MGQGPILMQSPVVKGLTMWPAAHSVVIVEAHSEGREIIEKML